MNAAKWKFRAFKNAFPDFRFNNTKWLTVISVHDELIIETWRGLTEAEIAYDQLKVQGYTDHCFVLPPGN